MEKHGKKGFSEWMEKLFSQKKAAIKRRLGKFLIHFREQEYENFINILNCEIFEAKIAKNETF